MSKPTIYYFPIRGRAEAVKIALVSKNVDFDVAPVDFNNMKSDLAHYPFGQCPRYADEDVDLVQSNSILRHIGRKFGLYGESTQDNALVDMMLDGVEDLRQAYVKLIYQDKLSDEAKAAYRELHISEAGLKQRNGGAHFYYLENLLGRNKSGSPWCTGQSMTVADAALFDIIDNHVRIYSDCLDGLYPKLAAHYAAVSKQDGVKAYLDGDKRVAQVNGNGLG